VGQPRLAPELLRGLLRLRRHRLAEEGRKAGGRQRDSDGRKEGCVGGFGGRWSGGRIN
jgi:hypothetical protein